MGAAHLLPGSFDVGILSIKTQREKAAIIIPLITAAIGGGWVSRRQRLGLFVHCWNVLNAIPRDAFPHRANK